MNKYLKYIVVMAVAIFSTASCKEKDVEVFGNDAYLMFEMPTYGRLNTPRDSVTLSFPALADDCVETTVGIKVRVIGKSAPYDRPINVQVDEAASTAKAGENYQLESCVLPADCYSVDLPLRLYRKDLKDKKVRLVLNIASNENFDVGFQETNQAVIWWGDMFIQPDNWETSNYVDCFGEFSATRYEFILKACGIVELPDPQYLDMLGFYNVKVRKALYEYNKQMEAEGKDPLVDELGIVEFPVWTGTGGMG